MVALILSPFKAPLASDRLILNPEFHSLNNKHIDQFTGSKHHTTLRQPVASAYARENPLLYTCEYVSQLDSFRAGAQRWFECLK